jgi:hypothetical protein
VTLSARTGEEEDAVEDNEDTKEEAPPPPPQFAALTVSLNFERWRMLLVQYVVGCQLPFNSVEQPEFRELLLYTQPSLGRYLVSSANSVKTWVTDEATAGAEILMVEMAQARSKIHLSIDIWTSPSRTPILGVCAHFLDKDLRMKHPLLGLKYISGSHTGLAMADIILKLMEKYGIRERWGVLIADNAENNDTACKKMVSEIYPTEGDGARRARCYGHMINLAAKAFIYGKNNEGFLAEAEQVVTLTARNQQAVQREMALWRKRGSFGKLHNVIRYIRGSSLREQTFRAYIDVVVEQNGGVVVGQDSQDSQDGPVSKWKMTSFDVVTRLSDDITNFYRS